MKFWMEWRQEYNVRTVPDAEFAGSGAFLSVGQRAM